MDAGKHPDEAGLRRRFVRLTIYNILSNLTVPLTGLADTGMLGHLADIRFLGGVAIASVIFDYLYWGLGFLRMGTTGTVAQALGREDHAEVQNILLRALVLALGLGFVILILYYPIRELGFALLSGEDAIKSAGRDYFNVRILGSPAVLCNFVLLGWLLGRERSALALVMTAAGNLTNVGLNYVFIFRFEWAATGAGLATAISQYLMLGIGLVFVFATGERFTRPRGIFDAARLIQLVRLNTDILIRTLCLLSAFALFLNFSATLGTGVLVVNSLLHNLITFAAFLIDGPALAGEILMGRFKGGGNLVGQRRAVRLAFGTGLGIAFVFLAIFFTAPDRILSLLTSHTDIIELAAEYRIWMIPYLLCATGAYVLDGLFLGLTRVRDLRNAMMVSVICGFLPCACLAFWLRENHLLWTAMFLFAFLRFISLLYLFAKPEPTRKIDGRAGGNV